MIKTVACMVSMAVIVGCSGSSTGEIKTYRVTGKVLYNDTPVEGATVSFWAPKAARAGAGITNDEGEFTLSSGAGDNQITVSKLIGETQALSSKVTLKDPAALAEQSAVSVAKKKPSKAAPPPKPLVPEKYTSLKGTPLKENVNAKGTNNFELKLVD